MASVEQHVEQEILQAESPISRRGDEIAVENPATGETVRTVPDLGAQDIAEMAARARRAQPEWEAGFRWRKAPETAGDAESETRRAKPLQETAR